MAGWWTDSHNHRSTIQFHDLTEKFHREAFLWFCMRLNADAFCASISINCQSGLNPCPNFFIWREKWRQDSGWKVEIKLTATPGPEPASHPRSSNIRSLGSRGQILGTGLNTNTRAYLWMQLSNRYECCTPAGTGTKYEYGRKSREQFIKGPEVLLQHKTLYVSLHSGVDCE